jgi:uncharacterized protein (TIGR04255 family)
MDLVFRNAPLVEIVSELRWQPAPGEIVEPIQATPGSLVPPFMLGTNNLETFFHRFGGELYQRGFQLTERLYPAGFPTPLGQVSCRYRSNDPAKATILYQVGAGIFSANATPPYRSWSIFAPEVRLGVEILLQTRDESEKELRFHALSLRYINAFRSNLIGGRNALAFLKEVLNIELSVPNSILKHVTPGAVYNPYLALGLPVSGGSLQMKIGEANIAGTMGMLLDMIFTSTDPIEPVADPIMSRFDAARAIIHDVFVNLTESIRDKMEPEH